VTDRQRDPADAALATLDARADERAVGAAVGTAGGWGARLSAHMAQPFFRNAYALVLNTGLTGALGLVYWFLAAARYSEADVGRGSTAISVMTLLSGLVAFNVTGTLNRFVPQSGRSVRRLLAYSYLLTSVAVLALTVGFLATLDLWGPSFDLFRDPTFRTWFLAAVVAASIFTIQDGVLTGLRSAVWIPLENAFFGVAKILLLVVLARSLPAEGVFLSWVVPMVIVLVPTNALIFGRLVPRHLAAAAGREPAYSLGGIWRFFAADYVGALFLFASVNLVPVMVADRVGPATYAHFFIAWVMGSLLNLVAVNLATSLSVEGVYDRTTLAANCRAALARALGSLLVVAVVASLAAPYVLRAFGGGYAAAVPLLQLMVFATLPRAVTEIHLGVLRAQGRARQIARVQITRGVLVLGSVFVCLEADLFAGQGDVSRITAVGAAVLLSQLVVALAVLPSLRRFLRDSGAVAVAVPARDHPGAGVDRLEGRSPVPGPAPAQAAAPGSSPPSPGERPARRFRPGWGPAAVGVLTVAAVVLFVVPLRGVDAGAANGFGLVSVLPVSVLVAVGLLTLAFGGALSLRRPRLALLGGQLVALVVLLHGITTVVEAEPRFPVSWVHAGFVEYISRTGTVAPGLDARFSWPGFFALVAFLVGAHGGESLRDVLTYTPVVSNLLFLLPLGLLLRNVRATWQARWLAMWLFVLMMWVGQDYFSPQGFTYLLYLVFVAVLVTWFRRPPTSAVAPRGLVRRRVAAGLWGRLLGRGVPGELPPPPIGHRERTVLLLLVIGLFTAATVSHQLTPLLMLFAATGLVLARRCTAKGLPLLLGVILLAWLSYMTVAYWSGHLGGLLSALGNLTGNVSSSVAERTEGVGAQHEVVVLTRIGTAVLVLGLAAVGLLRRRLHGFDDRILLVLMVLPFSALLLQDYGGEIALRIYLFALPAACCLVALAFFPRAGDRPGALSRLGALLCAAALAGTFFVARYGNESYEQIRAGEVAAVQTVYDRYGSGAEVLFPSSAVGSGATPFMPLGYRDIERVGWSPVLAPRNPADVAPLVAALREQGPAAVLIITRGQERYLEFGSGYPLDWGDRFRRSMAAQPGVRVVTGNADAVVYALDGAPGRPAESGSPAGSSPFRFGATPWTDVGLAFVVLLLGVLGWREVWRLRLRPGEGRRLLPLTFASVPLLVGLLAVVAERLVLLGS
jgi:O-antigen/teichoic acid export membrane protein